MHTIKYTTKLLFIIEFDFQDVTVSSEIKGRISRNPYFDKNCIKTQECCYVLFAVGLEWIRVSHFSTCKILSLACLYIKEAAVYVQKHQQERYTFVSFIDTSTFYHGSFYVMSVKKCTTAFLINLEIIDYVKFKNPVGTKFYL